MAKKIQIKRGEEYRLPELAPGEPAITLDTEKFFIGTETGNLELAKQKDVDNVNAQMASNAKQIGIGVQKHAKGDGTDETTLVQNALNEGAGKVVVFPYGMSFRVSSVLNVPDNTIIFGYGSKLYTNAQHAVLSLGNRTRVYGLEIQGAGNSTLAFGGRGIEFKGSDSSNYKSSVKIDDCHIHSFGGYGVFLEFVKDVYINKTKIENIGYAGIHGFSVENVHGDQLHIKGLSPGNNGLAYGVAFNRLATNGLATYPRSKDCSITNSLIEDNTFWEALDTHAGENIVFHNNTIKNCKMGIAVVPSQLNLIDDYAPLRCSVTNNKIYGLGLGVGVVVSGAMGVIGSPAQYSDENIVNGNILVDCGKTGDSTSGAMIIKGTKNITVIGNVLKNSYVFGINLYNDNKGFTVTGNSIVDVRDATYTVPSGIVLRDEYNFGVISDNSIVKDGSGLTDTYISMRGIYFVKTTNVDVVIGVNRITFDTPLQAAYGQNINYGTIGNGGAKRYAGFGAPEGVIAAGIGSEYTNLTGGAGTTKYVKESGTGNTGWIAK